MDDEKKRIGGIALLVICVALCLFLVGRQVSGERAMGEAQNPNFGHPASKEAHAQTHSTPGDGGDGSKEQYYEKLKFNRSDLSEAELREKTDHWWKVKNGDAQVTGG